MAPIFQVIAKEKDVYPFTHVTGTDFILHTHSISFHHHFLIYYLMELRYYITYDDLTAEWDRIHVLRQRQFE